MEEVLEVYQRPQNSSRPLICLDETTKQLIADTREPLPILPGYPEKFDFEYERHGVGTLFMLSAPLEGWRQVVVTERKTRIDYARVLKALSDDYFPQADCIVLVQDNLNTHSFSSLYEAFEPAEARRLRERFEVHYTPKHGSWLNMAEIELNVLSSQCLSRRIPNLDQLRQLVAAWTQQRNNSKDTIQWRFTTKDARIKLQRLYPTITPVSTQ